MAFGDQKLIFWMGFSLFAVQAVERVLGEVLTVALPEGGIISSESLTSDAEEHRRKTLGQLVKKLGKRAEVHPLLADRLDAFISRRNEFIHCFSDSFDLSTDAGREAAVAFCQELGTEAVRLCQVLDGILFGTFDRLEGVTQGAVSAGWDSMPGDTAESLKRIAELAPVLLRPTKR